MDSNNIKNGNMFIIIVFMLFLIYIYIIYYETQKL
jgi:hypothetical protein